MQRLHSIPGGAALVALAAALALGGCNRQPNQQAAANMAALDNMQTAALPPLPAPLPLAAGAATPAALAPAARALPEAPRPVSLGRFAEPEQAYAYLDRADNMFDSMGYAPPDYAFDYDGVNPWVWQTAYGDSEFVEPVPGGYRYYYYEPGYDEPYLIRDPDYSYAYNGATLVAIYAADGALLPPRYYRERADDAARYRYRARRLWEASREARREQVEAAQWQQRSDAIARDRERWNAERDRNLQWASYHRQNADRERAHWQPVALQRQAAAQRYENWRRQDFRGPAPAPVDHRAERRQARADRQARQQQIAQLERRQQAERLIRARQEAQHRPPSARTPAPAAPAPHGRPQPHQPPQRAVVTRPVPTVAQRRQQQMRDRRQRLEQRRGAQERQAQAHPGPRVRGLMTPQQAAHRPAAQRHAQAAARQAAARARAEARRADLRRPPHRAVPHPQERPVVQHRVERTPPRPVIHRAAVPHVSPPRPEPVRVHRPQPPRAAPHVAAPRPRPAPPAAVRRAALRPQPVHVARPQPPRAHGAERRNNPQP
ncbi:MAG TPA: hypothetical protein VFL92_12015 [Sphingomonas sp.]|nr:hypothetical protein [Sphingomonas sp.]